MRISFLLAFLIASTSAFAPLANTVRSNSALAGQAVMASPVRAAEKAPKKKSTTKASPPPKVKVIPLKGAPAKVSARPKAVFGLAGQAVMASPVRAAEKAPAKKSTTKASPSPPKKQVAPPSKASPMKGVPASKTTPRPKAVFGL
jgi:hypothetical protein